MLLKLGITYWVYQQPLGVYFQNYGMNIYCYENEFTMVVDKMSKLYLARLRNISRIHRKFDNLYAYRRNDFMKSTLQIKLKRDASYIFFINFIV